MVALGSLARMFDGYVNDIHSHQFAGHNFEQMIAQFYSRL
jgi:hypothetical protein